MCVNKQVDNDIKGKPKSNGNKKFEFFQGFCCVLKKQLYICTPQ